MNIRNTLIYLLNRLRLYNPLRDLYYRMRFDNGQRKSFLGQFVGQGTICFDVGANIGELTDIFRILGARVVAIEPQKDCAAYLRNKYNRDSMVTVIEKAVASKTGTCEMYACQANQLSTLEPAWLTVLDQSGRFGKIPKHQKIIIETITLDEIIRQYGKPDFIKVDVEGGEYEVLKNLKRPVPNIVSFEYTFPENRHNFERCVRHLDDLGQVVFNLSHDHKDFVFPNWLTCKELFSQLSTELANNAVGNAYAKFSS